MTNLFGFVRFDTPGLCYYFQCQIQNGDQIACSRPFTASSFLTLVSYCEISCNIKFLLPFFPIPAVMQMATSYFIRLNKNIGRDTCHFEISKTTISHSTFGRTDLPLLRPRWHSTLRNITADLSDCDLY